MGLFTNYDKVKNKILDSCFSSFIYYSEDIFDDIKGHPAYFIELFCYLSASIIVEYHAYDFRKFIVNYCYDLADLLDGQIQVRYEKAIDLSIDDFAKQLGDSISAYVTCYANNLTNPLYQNNERILEYLQADLYNTRTKQSIEKVKLVECSDMAKIYYGGK